MKKIVKLFDWFKVKYTLFNLRKNGKLKGLRNSIVKNPDRFDFKKVYIEKYCRIECITNYGKQNFDSRLIIGENTFIGYNNTILCAEKIEIGNNCLIASNVFISDENHGVDISGGGYIFQPLSTNPIIIGNNCWIGQNVCILPGVKLGSNVIVGAGSVVTKSFEKNTMIAGNPAEIIKKWDDEKQTWIKV